MIETSALPLRAVESKFATDSTGFATTSYQSWFDHKHKAPKVYAKWVKAHFTVGVKTHIVTAVEIRDKDANDCQLLASMLEVTTRHFKPDEVSADKAYSSKENLEAIANAGSRLHEIHMKDLSSFKDKGSQVPVGDGIMPVPAIFRQLRKINYAGVVSLEYEIDADNPLPGMQKSFAYMRGVIAGQKG